ncbi:MAG TPA: radical SAM protein, partial [Streptosporangiaceae bacterium]|nr:radical SAM protein [Streptosporangiaceae bacterium]
MALTPSRYLLIGKRLYRDASGAQVRIGYATRAAKIFGINPGIAAKLADGDLAALPPAELERLSGLRAIVDAAEDELDSVIASYRTGSADPGARAFTIMPTSYCNMACDYCGQEHFKSAVDQRRLERLAARVTATIADPATSRVTVTWFGGEPLLALRVVRELSAQFTAAADAAGKPYTARMATNGSLLTKATLTMLHRDCRLDSVVITIDGPEELHDRRRIKRNGIGSFHKTIAVLADVVRKKALPGLGIGIRINVDSENEDAVADLIVDLACFGLSGPQVDFQPMPVHSWGNDVSSVELEGRRYAAMESQWLALAGRLGIGFIAL